MVLVHNFTLVLLCCIYCCICWGSWANTQKLVQKKDWSFPLFYWDYIFGFFLTAVIGAFTLGSLGSEGESFLENFKTMDWTSVGWAMLGGIVWNAANIFLTAANAIAGMAVGFPIGGGLGWIGGVVFNYLLVVLAGQKYPGNEVLLWVGLVIAVAAILFCAKAYSNLTTSQHRTPKSGIVMAVISGIGLMFFYGLVVKSISPEYVSGGTGTLTPYSAVFFFALGVLISTPIVNGLAMAHPVEGGRKVTMKDYFTKGDTKTHLIGLLGGFIWMSGMVISFMGSGGGNPAVNYALSNASPVVAMIWGVLIWKEFKGAPKGTNKLLFAMFFLFVAALVLISMAN
ncbi:MAG TPA: multidrug DMT transporter permease [Candidatus Cryptobacteroides excrementigallinarum]|nr:multidrug DMT transporter permease [Candidatus Cryptobacteroides excrementigallinarum]